MTDRYAIQGTWNTNPQQYLDSPTPVVHIAGRSFCLTGVFSSGSKDEFHRRIQDAGGTVTTKPVMRGCYVVLGKFPNQNWKTQSAGVKLLEAFRLRDEGYKVFIISEEHFLQALEHASEAPSSIPQSYAEILWEDDLYPWLHDILGEKVELLTFKGRQMFVGVHLKEKSSKWLLRLYYSSVGCCMEVSDRGKWEFSKKKHLPEHVVTALIERMDELVALLPMQKKPRLRLPPDELQRRNTERKATMRAMKPTAEVLKAADTIIAMLQERYPEQHFEGVDTSKFYGIRPANGHIVLRLYYKTKNKYVEIVDDDKIKVDAFDNLDWIMQKMG